MFTKQKNCVHKHSKIVFTNAKQDDKRKINLRFYKPCLPAKPVVVFLARATTTTTTTTTKRLESAHFGDFRRPWLRRYVAQTRPSERFRMRPMTSEHIQAGPNRSKHVSEPTKTSKNLRKLTKTSRKLRDRRVRAVVVYFLVYQFKVWKTSIE